MVLKDQKDGHDFDPNAHVISWPSCLRGVFGNVFEHLIYFYVQNLSLMIHLDVCFHATYAHLILIRYQLSNKGHKHLPHIVHGLNVGSSKECFA